MRRDYGVTVLDRATDTPPSQFNMWASTRFYLQMYVASTLALVVAVLQRAVCVGSHNELNVLCHKCTFISFVMTRFFAAYLGSLCHH